MVFIDECAFKEGKQRSREWWSNEENYRISSINQIERWMYEVGFV